MEMADTSIAAPDLAQRRAMLEVLARAFRDNPMNRKVHGPSPRRRLRANRAGLRALVLDSVDSPDSHEGSGRVLRRVLCSGGRVVGGLIAIPPSARSIPPPGILRQLGCFWNQGLRAMELWSRVHVELGQIRPLEPHWYLAVLGVDPVWQGRGAGRLLLGELERLREEADEPRLAPVYLESDRAESVLFYQAHGFEERASRRVLGVHCVGLGKGFAGAGDHSCDPVRLEPPGYSEQLAGSASLSPLPLRSPEGSA